MRSLENAVTFAAIIFALGMAAIASFPYHVLTVEPPPARMEMLEAD